MLYVGFCRLCGVGPLGLRKCGGCAAIIVLCDECDAAWQTADLSAPPAVTDDPELPCPRCGASVLAEPSAWATREEVDKQGWITSAIAAGVFTLNRGEPLGLEGPSPIDDSNDCGC